MIRSVVIVGLVVALGVTSAPADEAAHAVKQFNLLGRWASDCADPARRGVVYEVDGNGRAVFVNAVGPHRILSATSNDGREVVLTIKFLKPNDEVRINVITMMDADSYVPTLNRNERNEYTVRDGVLLSSGKKMPALHRCGEPRLS